MIGWRLRRSSATKLRPERTGIPRTLQSLVSNCAAAGAGPLRRSVLNMREGNGLSASSVGVGPHAIR
jgi:hypothetical protein